MSEEANRARRLLESCQMPGYDPEGAETYPAVEDGGVNSIGNALAAAQVLATLALAEELHRSNEDRASFNTTMREFFERLTEQSGDVSSLHSEQPAAAPDGQEGDEPRACLVCGKADVPVICTKGDGPLTREQWLKHHDNLYYESQEYGANKVNAAYWADSQMEKRFGPCPEES